MKENQSLRQIEEYMKKVRQRRILKRLWRFSKNLFVGFVFLVILAWVLLQNEGVQNWLVKRIASNLSERMETKIELDRVSFGLFDRLSLEGFYMEDLEGDTLIYSQRLNTSLSANLIGLIRNRIDVDDVALENAQVNLKKGPGEAKNNLSILLAKLSDPQKKKKSTGSGRPLILDVDNIDLTNVHFSQMDSVKGNFINVFVDQGKVTVDLLDLPELNFVVNTIQLNEPTIDLVLFDGVPLSSTEVDTTVTAVSVKDTSAPVLSIAIHHLKLGKANVNLKNLKGGEELIGTDSLFNPKNIAINELNIDIDSISASGPNRRAQIQNISFKTNTEFELVKLKADQFEMTNRKIEVDGLLLKTPKTEIKDHFALKYRKQEDLKEFADKVLLQADFDNSKICLNDVMAFLPKLSNNPFFLNNKNSVLSLDGRLSGRVNNLRGRNLDIRLGSGLVFKGSFSSRNLTKRTEESLNLKVERLYADVKTLRQLIPNFNPPRNFDKLGQLDFSGRFDGFFIDFVAYGNLKTELGEAAMDMRMDLRKGRNLAQYTGNLSLNNFDLATWSGNPNFGTITFSSNVTDGIGLTLETANAKLNANVDEFGFRGYSYQNLAVEGTLNKNRFDGKLNIKDDNIDLQFDGLIDNSGEAPDFNFTAAINKMDLKALNLSKKAFQLSGGADLRLQDINPETFTGTALIKNIKLVEDDTLTYQLDSAYLIAQTFPDQRRSVQLKSEIITAELNGIFKPVQVSSAVAAYLVTNFPEFAEKANVKVRRDTIADQQFSFNIEIIDTKNITRLFAPQLDTLKGINIAGDFNNVDNWLNLEFDIPQVAYNNVLVKSVYGKIAAQDANSNIELGVYHTRINEKRHFQPIYVNGGLDRDTIDFNISATNFTKEVDDLNLGGKIYLFEDFFELNLASTALIILQDKWQIQKNNYIRYKKDHIDIRNLQLTDGDRAISLESTSSTGIEAKVNGFDLSVIDSLWSYKEMDFHGGFNLQAKAKNIFKLEGLDVNVEADTFQVNEDVWGALSLEAYAKNLKEPITAGFTIGNDTQRMVADGYVNLPGTKRTAVNPHTFEVNADIKNYPLSIAEYWIGNGVTDTRGQFDGRINIYSGDSGRNIDGEVQVKNLEVTINYLQTRYRTPSGTMKINNDYLFDVTNNFIYDKYGNAAALSGGIRHDFFKRLRLDATISADNFLCLDTKKGDNELFYGHAMGTGTVLFSGPFSKANFDIDVRSEPNTRIDIPLEDKKSASEVKFIRYIDKSRDSVLNINAEDGLDIKGIALNMDIEVTPEANIRMIFDEDAGDIMEGRGSGDLQLQLSREGAFTMNGEYVISEGNYLFTLYNFVNKPFKVKEGGTIRWTGDPFNARLDVEAEYNVSTSIYNFIIEYLNTPGASGAARNRTQVDLTMLLDGQLQKPDINFEVEFPNLTGELRNYTESKLRQLEQDPNELNRQVFGLMVFGSFLPSSQQGLEGANSFLGGLNTVSEFISNQLSLYISELFSEVVNDVDFISGINFNVDYNVYDAGNIDNLTTDGSRGNNLAFGVELDLDKILDRRLTLSVGTDIDWGGLYSTANGAYFAGEYTLEYALTKDGRFKVRFYHQINNDQNTIDGRRNKFGLGFSYRKEFDNFNDFFKSMKKTMREDLEQRGRRGLN